MLSKNDELRIGGPSMKKKYYIGVYLLVAILVIVFDQVTKWFIATSMKIGDSYEVIPNFLNITSLSLIHISEPTRPY